MKHVWFGDADVTIIQEDSSWRTYRIPEWFLVSVRRRELEKKIQSVYTVEHREKIKIRNGIV